MLKELEKYCNVIITYNDHKIEHRTVKEYLEEYKEHRNFVFILNDKDICINENKLWELHIYPITPIGSMCVYGSDIDKLIQELIRIIKKEYGI